jgi:hypothetical protein
MSPLGQKQMSSSLQRMSALIQKADMQTKPAEKVEQVWSAWLGLPLLSLGRERFEP